MMGLEWVVVAGGLAAILWVNWYFFVAGQSGAAAVAVGGAGVPQVTIVVQGGYSPAVVRARAGQPVRLVFDRRETSSCSEEVVFPDFGVRKFLPTGERTAIEITPRTPGRYEFMCGMIMLRGALIAEE